MSNKKYRLADLIQGLDATIKGDSDCLIEGVGTITHARAGQITFLMNQMYRKYLPTTQAGAVILMSGDAEYCPVNAVICRDPYYTYAKIAAFFEIKPTINEGIHPTAVIGKQCNIDSSAKIGPYCVIGDNVTIGAKVILNSGCVIGNYSSIDDNTYFHPHVTVYSQVRIGKRVLIASGTVIGSDGFGIAKHAGIWHKVPQLGGVVIEDEVEIGSNCAIDRGAIEDTVIEKGVKLDNLIQVGHNVRIGANTAIAACVGISGSTVIGKNCMIGGQSGFAGHLVIADNVIITGATEVTKSIREPGIYSSGIGGLVTNLEWRKNSARVQRLDKLIERVKQLEIELTKIKERSTQ